MLGVIEDRQPHEINSYGGRGSVNSNFQSQYDINGVTNPNFSWNPQAASNTYCPPNNCSPITSSYSPTYYTGPKWKLGLIPIILIIMELYWVYGNVASGSRNILGIMILLPIIFSIIGGVIAVFQKRSDRDIIYVMANIFGFGFLFGIVFIFIIPPG